MKVIKIGQNTFYGHFEGFLTIICDVKIVVIMCETCCVNLLFL